MTGFSQRLLDPGTRLNMFEVFKHHIVQDLGPLCPNWFEELTVSAARDGTSVADPETSRGACVQDAFLGTPLRKPAVDSQIFSTPKIFKSRAAQSPEHLTTDEELFSPDRGAAGGPKTSPWADTNKRFFGSAKNSQTADKLCNTSLAADNFALLNIPKCQAAVSAKSISESLGAQLDPDVSWTSSLNTPPLMFPTVILAKEEDKAGPVCSPGDKRVILVRELFPSMSKVSPMTDITEKPEGLFGQTSEADGQTGGLMKGRDCRELPSADARGDGLWKQTLPDAIRDGEVRSTVASVLDGAEDVLSIFFSDGSSSSALRRVKAQERSNRRRLACSAKAAEPTPPPPPPPPPALQNGRPEDPAKTAGRSERIADTFAFHKGNSPEVKQDCGVTQWTPFTLPDTSDTGAGTDFCAVVPSSVDRGTAPANEELAERPADAAQLEKPACKGDSDVMVPGDASAQRDSVFPANVANTVGKNVGPLHSAFPQQRAKTLKSSWTGDSRPATLPVNPPFSQSDSGKCTMSAPADSPGNKVCGNETHGGVLVLQPDESSLPGSSLDGCPAVTSTRKPPRKFVYSLPSPQLYGRTNHNQSDHSRKVSTATVPFPGDSLNGSGDAVESGVKALRHSDNVTKDKSECKKLCEQASDASTVVAPAASNEAESRLDYPPLLCATSVEDYSQERNPGKAPSGSADVLARDTDTLFRAKACPAVMGSQWPSQPSPRVLTEKPGHADDRCDRDIVDCPSHGAVVLTECTTQASDMSGLLRASDTTRVTCDSGYHATWSGATQFHGSSDIGHVSSFQVPENRAPVGFKTASNRIIPLSLEAIQRAKALLDEGAEGSGINSSISKGKPQMSESTEWNRKSHYSGTISALMVSSAAASPRCLPLRKASSLHNSTSSPQGSSPNPGFVGFKTASNSTIRLSSANLLKAKQLFKDIEDEKLSEDPSRTNCTEVEAESSGMSKSSAGLMAAAPLLILPSSEQKGSEAYGCLTASQRADVTELCSLLEEASSQFDFTQFKQAKSTSAGSDVVCNQPCDKEVDPDFLTGIDFDDSFSSDGERQGPRKLLADTIMAEKLTASSYHKQSRQDTSHKLKPVEVLSCDSTDKNAKCPDPEHPSASLVPKNNHDSGSFVSFSSASGKKIAVSREVLARASKVFDDLDVGCFPSSNSVRDKGTDPSHLNVPAVTVTEVQRARNIPAAHVTFNTPMSKAINQNHCIKKTVLPPGAVSPGGRSLKWGVSSRNTQTFQEDSDISESNLPSGEPDPPLVCSSFQLPTVKNNLESAGTSVSRDILPPCAPNGVGTDGRLDEHPPPTPAVNSAEGEKVPLKQPRATCLKGGLQRDTGKKLEISHNLPSSMSTEHGTGFKTARGTAVNVSEGLLRKAREMFADLGDNMETAHGRGYRGDEQERWNALAEDEELPDKSANTTNKAKNTSGKCKSENGAVQRTSAADYDADEPDAINVVKEIDMTSLEEDFSRTETPNIGSESNVGYSTTCANIVCLAEKLPVETTSNECGRISGSCQMAAVSDEGSGNISTSNIQGNCGFSTAGGKKVTVSKKSLQYAQFLLNECSEMKTPETGKTSILSNGHVSSLSLLGGNSGGFQTASGKGVSITPNALEQAKAMFQNCDDRPECGNTGAVIGEGVSGKTRGSPMNPTSTSSGFVSASGKGVSISAKALLEVKDMFKNSDGIVDSAATYGPREGNTNERSFELKSNFGKLNCGFSSAGGKRVSVSEKALLRANALLKECDKKDDVESERLKCMTPDPQNKNGCGFSTASGKGVSVSLRTLQAAKARFADCDNATLPDVGEVKAETLSENSTSAHKRDSTNSNCGFSTASGRGVSVSEKALLKAKALLSECSDVESGEPGRLLKMECESRSVPNPPRESRCGISAGSGKGLSTSAKNICEMEVSLKDCSSDRITVEIQGNNLKVKDDSYNNTGKCTAGFSTARGNQVSVSVKALEEAKAKFRDCDNLDHVFGEEMKMEPIKNKSSSTHRNPDKSPTGINTASETVLPSTNLVPAESDRIEHFVVPSSCKHLPQGPISQGRAADSRSARENIKAPAWPGGSAPSQERSAPPPGKAAVVPAGCETTTRRSSSLNLHSPGLSSCSDTQQSYLEQEAMACTRALLADEDLAERGLREAPGSASLQPSSAEGTRARGKRLQSDHSDFPDQPPLKRRLLGDFDQISDSDKRAVLTPVKSNPNVTLRDRRIFRYGVPLQPNVTRPPGDKKSILDHRHRKTEPQVVVPGSFLQDSKPVNPRGAVFVPPFRKGPKPEVQGTSLPAESRRPPSTFAPPSRKSQPNSTLLGEGPSRRVRPGTPPLPAVFVPPLTKSPDPASRPDGGSVEKVSSQESGTHRATPHSACSGALSGQCPVTPNVPAGREAEPEEPAPAPPSPGDQEAISSDVQTLQNLQLARDLQDMRIRKKRRQTIRPQPGSLLLAKTSGVSRVSLRSAVGGRCPGLHTPKELYACGVPHGVSQVSSDSAESFRFRCRDFFREEVLAAGGGVQLADGGRLVPGNDGTAGKEEFYRALCDTPGVDPKLISECWLYNHYRWVVWKRASMERAFPSVMGSYCLTPEQVLLQLKYRYDVEVDRSRRSALRKIMERDDTPAKTMVLCVCGVASTGPTPAPAGPVQPGSRTSPGSGAKAGGGSPGAVIWVTDGWYAIKALLDAPLTVMLLKGRLAVGGKVVTHGAELVGSQDACPPLEAPESLMLKISANSTRPARWDAKLGFHRDPRPFRLPLSSLYCNGGVVGCVDLVVLRSYPTQWMEKKPGGVFVFRNERNEEREARRHSESKHKAMEVLFGRIQAQFEKEHEAKTKAESRRRRLTRQEIEALQDGEELHEAVETDPLHLESCLNEQQLAVLSSYRESLGQERQARLQERFRQALADAQEGGGGGCSDRDVTPVWKLSVCDSRDRRSGSVYILSIWRPPAELRPLLREGCRYRVYQLATSWGKKQAGRAAVQLTGTKKTQFQRIQASPESMCEMFQPRVSWSFRALRGTGIRPVCGEVDVVGYVVSVTDRHGPSPVLHLADGHQDFVSVRIGASLAQLALEELVKPRALLALSNLQPGGHRTPAPVPVPVLHAGELALFSANPKEPHLQQACAQLRSVAQGNERFFQMAEEKLSNFLPSNNQSALLSPRDVGPSSKVVNGQIPHQALRNPGLCTPVSRRPPGPASTSEEQDPKSVKRKRGLDFLSRIPSPPPLSPLLTSASPSLKKTFNPPRRSETPRPASGRPAPPPHHAPPLRLNPPPCPAPPPAPPMRRAPPPQEAEWVNDEELAMINTQALLDGLGGQEEAGVSR